MRYWIWLCWPQSVSKKWIAFSVKITWKLNSKILLTIILNNINITNWWNILTVDEERHIGDDGTNVGRRWWATVERQSVVPNSCHESSCLQYCPRIYCSQAAYRRLGVSVPAAVGRPSHVEAATKVEQTGDVEPVEIDFEQRRRVAADSDTAQIRWLASDQG